MKESKPQAVLFDVGETLLGFPVHSWDEVDEWSAQALAVAIRRLLPGGSTPTVGPVPTADDLLRVLREVVARASRLAAAELREVRAREVLRATLEQVGLSIRSEADLDILERAWADPRLVVRRVYPETHDVIAALRKAGIRLGLISNIWVSGPIVREHLDSLGLLQPFECVVLSSEAGYVKPHPSLFRQALDAMHLDAARTWYVGDNPVADVLGAKSVGMRAALVRRPPAARFVPSPPAAATPYEGPDPDMIVSSLSDLLVLSVPSPAAPPIG